MTPKSTKLFLNRCLVNSKRRLAIKNTNKNLPNSKIWISKIYKIWIIPCTNISCFLNLIFKRLNYPKISKLSTFFQFYTSIMRFSLKNKCLSFRIIEFLNGDCLKEKILLLMPKKSSPYLTNKIFRFNLKLLISSFRDGLSSLCILHCVISYLLIIFIYIFFIDPSNIASKRIIWIWIS